MLSKFIKFNSYIKFDTMIELVYKYYYYFGMVAHTIFLFSKFLYVIAVEMLKITYFISFDKIGV